jgi:hypothetical protein
MLQVKNHFDGKGFLTLSGVDGQNVDFVEAGHKFDKYLLELKKGLLELVD